MTLRRGRVSVRRGGKVMRVIRKERERGGREGGREGGMF